jgi:hypothetical protein
MGEILRLAKLSELRGWMSLKGKCDSKGGSLPLTRQERMDRG